MSKSTQQKNEEADHQKLEYNELDFLYIIQHKESLLILEDIKTDNFVTEDTYSYKYWKTKDKCKENLTKFLSKFPTYTKNLKVYKKEFGFEEIEINELKRGYKEQSKTNENILFKKLNKLCLSCDKDCKQSSKVVVMRCEMTSKKVDKSPKNMTKKRGI